VKDMFASLRKFCMVWKCCFPPRHYMLWLDWLWNATLHHVSFIIQNVHVCVILTCMFQMEKSMSLCCLTINLLLRSSWMLLTQWTAGPGGDGTGVPESSKWSRWKSERFM